ncbi:muscarinic acetylcholine receptor M5-like [Asterias rubens]|uniref:muscarinic acetylcholine receptor M5-like n=1 Tax=Asterias rubens TaxID=7604 RepID=UPI0014557714|nr:muscarinic acetylcholine receptor M5-like [Asterias rubens]
MENNTEFIVEESSYVYDLLGEFSHPLPIELVISTLVWLIWLLSAAGNILVFIVILGDKQLRSNVANHYILNLSSADLCVGLNSLIFNNLWRYFGNWPFGRAVCTFWTILDYAACMQSAFAIVLISMDRYFLVTKFLKYQKYQSRVLSGVLIGGTWSVSLLFFAVPVLGNGLWAQSKDVVIYSVTCDFGVLYIFHYNILQILVGFVTPAIFLAFFNINVYANILKRSKTLVRTVTDATSHNAPIDPAMPSSLIQVEPKVPTGQINRNLDTRKSYKKHRKAAITLAIIVGMFSLSWVPYYVVQLLFIVKKPNFTWLLWNSVYYTVWVNSAINPFIYAATSPRIRKGFIKVLCFWNRRLMRKIHPI